MRNLMASLQRAQASGLGQVVGNILRPRQSQRKPPNTSGIRLNRLTHGLFRTVEVITGHLVDPCFGTHPTTPELAQTEKN